MHRNSTPALAAFVVARCDSSPVQKVDVANVVNSASATAEYLVERGSPRVYLLGAKGLQEELTNAGISFAGGVEVALWVCCY
jgi:ribonucleotide monophosphatase NagD (HAD superfamily)